MLHTLFSTKAFEKSILLYGNVHGIVCEILWSVKKGALLYYEDKAMQTAMTPPDTCIALLKPDRRVDQGIHAGECFPK